MPIQADLDQIASKLKHRRPRSVHHHIDAALLTFTTLLRAAGITRWAQLDRDTMEIVRDALAESYATSTGSVRLTYVRMLIGEAVAMGRMTADPSEGLTILNSRATRYEALTDEQLERLWRQVAEDPRIHAILRIMLSDLWSTAEICRLKVSDYGDRTLRGRMIDEATDGVIYEWLQLRGYKSVWLFPALTKARRPKRRPMSRDGLVKILRDADDRWQLGIQPLWRIRATAMRLLFARYPPTTPGGRQLQHQSLRNLRRRGYE